MAALLRKKNLLVKKRKDQIQVKEMIHEMVKEGLFLVVEVVEVVIMIEVLQEMTGTGEKWNIEDHLQEGVPVTACVCGQLDAEGLAEDRLLELGEAPTRQRHPFVMLLGLGNAFVS